jgi:hypothetical protein
VFRRLAEHIPDEPATTPPPPTPRRGRKIIAPGKAKPPPGVPHSNVPITLAPRAASPRAYPPQLIQTLFRSPATEWRKIIAHSTSCGKPSHCKKPRQRRQKHPQIIPTQKLKPLLILFLPRRGYATKPKVARRALPWESSLEQCNLERGCGKIASEPQSLQGSQIRSFFEAEV